MSVMIVTSLGDLVLDLFTDRCPLTCKNFLKLCKIKYYNGCLFHTIQKDFTTQTGDPTGTGTGGDSIYKFLYGDQARFFGDEIHFDVKHSKMGTVAMASAGENLNASQFYITLRDDLDYLDGKHTVFGEVAEGLDALSRINDAYADGKNRPYKNIRIKHTYILDDPFDDPPGLAELIPGASPEGKPKDEVDDDVRLEDDWVPLDETLDPQQIEELLNEKDAHSRALVLEAIEDIPDAEMKPPDNVLFVCKLNPVTEDEDLHTIFSRFGIVTSAEVIRDHKTGDSLCYAFIEFKDIEACEQAYFKMDNVLIDDRRIHVDFSQSVAKLWSQYRRKGRGGQGGGCNKCGSFDHIAKDCTGDSMLKQPQTKYELKDDNIQHGGAGSKRYDMVFDEDDDLEARNSNRRDHDEKRSSQRQDGHNPEHRDNRRRRTNEGGRQHHRSSERRGDEGYPRHERSSYRGTEGHPGKNGSSGGRQQELTIQRSSADEREQRRYDDEVKLKRRRDEEREKSHRDVDSYGYKNDKRKYEKGAADDSYGYKNDKRKYEKGAADDIGHGEGKRGDGNKSRNGTGDPKRYHTDRRDARDDKYDRKQGGEERYSGRSSKNDDFHDRGRRH